MITEVDRSKCRWRGLHIPTLRKALKTGKPAFNMNNLPKRKCPVCGRRFDPVLAPCQGQHQRCCSESCDRKLIWIRRKA